MDRRSVVQQALFERIGKSFILSDTNLIDRTEGKHVLGPLRGVFPLDDLNDSVLSCSTECVVQFILEITPNIERDERGIDLSNLCR